MASEEYRRWVTYYVETEAFDRTLPGRWSASRANLWVVLYGESAKQADDNDDRVTGLVTRGLPLNDEYARAAADVAREFHRDRSKAEVYAALGVEPWPMQEVG